jgi:hypothetical protein
MFGGAIANRTRAKQAVKKAHRVAAVARARTAKAAKKVAAAAPMGGAVYKFTRAQKAKRAAIHAAAAAKARTAKAAKKTAKVSSKGGFFSW